MSACFDGKHEVWIHYTFKFTLFMQFLTNAFMVPYMALRERLPESVAVQKKEKPKALPSYSKLLGGVAFFIAGVSAVWLFAGRPEYGGLDARWQFAVEQFQGNRAFWAFVIDLGLYSVWQAFLMEDCGAPKKYQYVPFFGLASWLIVGGSSLKEGLRTGFWDPADDWQISETLHLVVVDRHLPYQRH